MENKIIEVQGSPKIQAIIDKARRENIYVAELDGLNIHDVEDFLVAIEEGFQFPVAIDRGLFERIGVIQDMYHFEWLKEYDGYMLVINNYNELMKGQKNANRTKNFIIYECIGMYITLWNEDKKKTWLPTKYTETVFGISYGPVAPENHSFGSRRKQFNVYLVD